MISWSIQSRISTLTWSLTELPELSENQENNKVWFFYKSLRNSLDNYNETQDCLPHTVMGCNHLRLLKYIQATKWLQCLCMHIKTSYAPKKPNLPSFNTSTGECKNLTEETAALCSCFSTSAGHIQQKHTQSSTLILAQLASTIRHQNSIEQQQLFTSALLQWQHWNYIMNETSL